jgi:methylmalonyl-CoA mutase
MSSRPPHLDRATPELGAWFEPHTVEAWQQAALQALKGRPLGALITRGPSGVTMPAMVPPGPAPALGLPDQAPYLRGAGGLDRREAGWDVRQLLDAGSLAEAGAAVQDALGCAVRSFWLVPDGAGRGFAEPATGLPLRTLSDLDALLAGVEIGAVGLCIEPGEAPLGWLAALEALAARRGAQPIGAVPYDPLSVLASRGVLELGLDGAAALVAELVQAAARVPEVRLLGTSGLVWADGGAHAALELAGMLASAAWVLRAVEAGGGTVEAACGTLQLQVSVQRDTFEEIAKLRALRLLWSKLIAACGGEAVAQRAVVHAVTSATGYARRDPWSNLLRGTHGAFVAAVAGADAVTVLPFDRPLGVPSALGGRVALNAQAVLEAEAHLARVLDPAGGSRYVEALTEQLAREAWRLFQEVEGEGGIVEALRAGSWQARLAGAAEARAGAVARRAHALIGVNLYPTVGAESEVRADVAATACTERRGLVGEALRAAVVDGAPVGQVGAASGRPERVLAVPVRREAEGWEALRARVEALGGPRVLLLTPPPAGAHKARQEFTERLFEAGGFVPVVAAAHGEAGELLRASGAVGVCVCGDDRDYPEAVPAWAASFKAAGARFVAVAGRPGAHEPAWAAAGLDLAIFTGGDVLGALATALSTLEVE